MRHYSQQSRMLKLYVETRNKHYTCKKKTESLFSRWGVDKENSPLKYQGGDNTKNQEKFLTKCESGLVFISAQGKNEVP